MEQKEKVQDQTATEQTPQSKPKKARPSKALIEAQQKAEALQEQLLRTLAEYDNYRKRTQREKEGMYGDGIVYAVKSFLPVIDNLERALAAADAESGGLADGVKMVADQVNNCLQALGVTPLGIQGETFDPNLHMAVLHVEDEALQENVVKEVLQKGYIYKNEQVIRAASVMVAN